MNKYLIMPNYIKCDKNLNSNEKIILAEVRQLSIEKGYCSKTNAHFADMLNLTKASIKNYISKLSKDGYIKVKMILSDKKEVLERRIYPINKE